MPPDSDAEALLTEALRRPPDDRAAFLRDVCEDQPELRAMLEDLIRESDDVDPFIEPGGALKGPLWQDLLMCSGDSIANASASEPPSAVIGRYRLTSVLGEGGMGAVYLAEQEEPIRRTVAVKVIKLGMDSREVVRRFEAERQALALMDHPSIARVFDAGTTDQGRPYFVMEYVAGAPITTYCDTHRLTIRERIELFLKVCDAVQHAHQKGIIHRDIKPSNVLIAEQDGEPLPKVIDFGVAKATAQRLTAATVHTRLDQLIGTPEYMSPEQADMTAQTPDTRADVYSLAMVLYELLVGALPLDRERYQAVGFEELLRTIRGAALPKPSVRVSQLGETLCQAVRNRRSDPRGLVRQLTGDLDWVVMRALEKAPARRYPSASELAADLGRYLRHQPVLAGPPGAAYRMLKFARRHRVGVVAIAAVVVALTSGAATATVGMLRAQRSEARALLAERGALREAQAAREVSNFLVDLFKVSDPGEARGRTVTAREVLDRGAAKIRNELADQPLVRARLMSTIGGVYRNLGLFEQSAIAHEEALKLREAVLPRDDPELAEALNSLAIVYHDLGDYEPVEQLLQRALQIGEARAGRDSRLVAQILKNLALLYGTRGHYEQAEPLYQRGLEILQRVLGPDHPEVALMMESLAALYSQQGRFGDADPLLSKSVAINEKSFGPDHPNTADSLASLGRVRLMQGRYPEAEPLLARAVRLQERILGPQHPVFASHLRHLANVYWSQGRYNEVEPLYLRVLQIAESTLGPRHPEVAKAVGNLGTLYHRQGRYREAEPLFERNVQILEASLGPEHPELAKGLANLSVVNRELGRVEMAERLQMRALEIRRKVLGADHPDVAWSLRGLGEIYEAQKRFREAERTYRAAVELRERILGPDHSDLATALNSLGHALLHLKRAAEAKSCLDRARRILERAFGPVHPDVAASLHGLARVHLHYGRYGEAAPLLERALVIREKTLGGSHPLVASTRKALSGALHAMGRDEEALALEKGMNKTTNTRLPP